MWDTLALVIYHLILLNFLDGLTRLRISLLQSFSLAWIYALDLSSWFNLLKLARFSRLNMLNSPMKGCSSHYLVLWYKSEHSHVERLAVSILSAKEMRMVLACRLKSPLALQAFYFYTKNKLRTCSLSKLLADHAHARFTYFAGSRPYACHTLRNDDHRVQTTCIDQDVRLQHGPHNYGRLVSHTFDSLDARNAFSYFAIAMLTCSTQALTSCLRCFLRWNQSIIQQT